ncbi:MAG: DUF4234 domain-containing protein [Candidatus Nanohaloarchaea archaeon]|nr:DUF4234 domain-containing protein [Candidatus Nanohaloarchaea archaeon]
MARSPFFVVLLTVATLGVYGVYWFHTTSSTVIAASHRDSTPLLWTAGLFVPVVNAFVLWRFIDAVNAATGRVRPLPVFLLFAIFFPAGQYRVQQAVNRAAGDPHTPVPP